MLLCQETTGILKQASNAKERSEKANIKEKIELAVLSVKTNHTGSLEGSTVEEFQKELGNDYLVTSSSKYTVVYKKSNDTYNVSNDGIVSFCGQSEFSTTTKNGEKNNPVILSEDGISNAKINYSDGQALTVLGTNRFNLEQSTFKMISYNSKHTITKENNGIAIKSEDFDTVNPSCYAYVDLVAEFTGKIWISCNASTSGDIKDIGMRISVNGIAQELCRGEGKLAETVNVTKGDSLRLLFYSHIGTLAGNTIYYKDIMLQYEKLTDYVPYTEDINSMQNVNNSITLNGEEGGDAYTTGTTANGGTDYKFHYNTNIEDSSSGILPVDNNTKANVSINGLNLKTYNEIYNNQIGIGISTTGIISIYLGTGYNRDKLIEYLRNNPITITYATVNQEFVGISKDIKLSTGNIITSDSDFSVSYSYLDFEDTIDLVCFGDSITGMFSNETDYPSMISRESNINAYNVGFTGCKWTDHVNSKYNPFSMNRLVDAICDENFSSQDANAEACGGTYPERLKTLKNINFLEIDYVTIFYGTNDWGSNAILRSEDDLNTTLKQQTNVEDSIKYCIRRMQEKYPNLKIIVISPLWRSLNGGDSDFTPNSNGDYLHDYSNFIDTVAKNDCKVETINMYDKLNININNYNQYLSDGTHPNEKLKHIIANIIIETVNN